jgi:hypothetical protein
MQDRKMTQTKVDGIDYTKWVSIGVAMVAAIITGANVYVTYLSYGLNAENQKAALFSQFQNEYSSIASNFPDKLLDANFKPARGSSDYKKLQDYWIFCYAEWYQTKRTGQGPFLDMWDNYYAGLIANALEIPSLKYVIIDMMNSYGLKQQSVQSFYNEIRNIGSRTGVRLDK